MNQVFHFIKLGIALITGTVAVVCLGLQLLPLATAAGVTSLAWSLMPE
jgi:hypothetical protein